jgi:uncharacterized protein (TIGR03435 family)
MSAKLAAMRQKKAFRNIGTPVTPVSQIVFRVSKRCGVLALTGFDGRYDVALETSQPHVDPASGMEDPGVTIFECVAKLGLKLEPRKVLVDTLVIDNLSKMPTEN